MYPALAVLERLNAKFKDVQTLWVGGEGGMEAGLVASVASTASTTSAGIAFEAIPAAGLHGVGLRALPGNFWRLVHGFFAARRLLRQFRPEVLFFTGGYVAAPVALAGWRVPTALFIPDIEPGLALKALTRFADRIAITAADSQQFFPRRAERLVETGYPVRHDLINWDRSKAQAALGLQADLPTLLVFGGSKGARSINRALFAALPDLLAKMQIVHISGTANWEEAEAARDKLAPHLASRYHAHPYLHDEMGAALAAADLVVARGGASTLGEFPVFGLPAILVPYPYAWRYQKVNADYLAQREAAVILSDDELPQKLAHLVRELMQDANRRQKMSTAMRALARPDAAAAIAEILHQLAQQSNHLE